MECLDKAFPCVRGLYLVRGEGLNLSGFVWGFFGARGTFLALGQDCRESPWQPTGSWFLAQQAGVLKLNL